MRNVKLGVLAIAMAMACGEEKPARGLVLVLDSDLTIPDSVNEVGLYVEHVVDGRRTVILAQEAKPLFDPATRSYTLPFTQSFVVEAGVDTKNERIRARFVAYAPDGSVVAMREARSSLPLDGVRQLRLPIRFVNEGRVQDAQRTGPVPADTDMAIRQIAADSRTDPFGRFRHAECAEDQTLGDDGECTPIDVEPSQLTEGETVTASATCFDTAACFVGTQSARIFPLEPGCKVTLPPRSGSELAVAIPSRTGYPVVLEDAAGREIAERVQPVDSGLYVLAGNVLTLKPALCKRAERDAVTTVLVSAQCQARSLDAPICAGWQRVDAAAPVTGGRFVEESDDLDASTDADAQTDAETDQDADAASDAGRDDGFDRIIDLPANTSSLSSFAANRTGAAWFLLDGVQPTLLRMSAGQSSPAAPDPNPVAVTTSAIAFVELGADGSLYTLPRPETPTPRVPTVLRPAGTTMEPVLLGPGCGAAPSDLNFFTVGTFNGTTVAMYGASSDLPFLTGGPVQDGNPRCFPARPTNLTNYATYLERGSTFDGKWRMPIVHDTQLAYLDPGLGSTEFDTPLTHPDTEEAVALQSFIDIGNDRAIAVGRSLGSSYDVAYFPVTKESGVPKPDQARSLGHQNRWVTREVFGAHGMLCGRMLERPFSAEVFHGIECVTLDGNGDLTSFESGTGQSVSELHVYGDDTYLYVAKLCHDGFTPKRARVRATPWAQVTATIAEMVNQGCSNPGN